MKKVRAVILFVSLIFIPFLAGCHDSKPVDDQVYALAIGVDKGVDNKLRVTLQYPTYKGGGGEDSTSHPTDTVIGTVEAPSILEAIDLFGTSTRRISLVHTKAIIFSEEFARGGIGSFLQPIARFRETRRIMQVIVCKGTAADYMKENKTLIGQSLAKSMELRAQQSESTGFFPRALFTDFYKGVISPYSNSYAIFAGVNEFTNIKNNIGESGQLRTGLGLLPQDVPRVGDVRTEYVGTAVFNGDKMVGALDSYETRFFLILIGQFIKGIMTIEDPLSPGHAIVLDLRLGREPDVEVNIKNNRPQIDVSLNIEADIISIQSRLPYEKPEKLDIINNQIKKEIKKGTQKVIEKLQKELGCDILGFGRKGARNFLSIQEFEDFNWKKNFPKAEIKVNVEADVRRTGLMIQSSPIIYNDSKLDSEKP